MSIVWRQLQSAAQSNVKFNLGQRKIHPIICVWVKLWIVKLKTETKQTLNQTKFNLN